MEGPEKESARFGRRKLKATDHSVFGAATNATRSASTNTLCIHQLSLATRKGSLRTLSPHPWRSSAS